MASAMRKMAVYLGLVEDERRYQDSYDAYGDYDEYEEPAEEWLLVVSGSPTLRHPGGEEQLEPWDIVFFPAGPSGAHLVRNNSESTARVAMFSSKSGAIGVVVYPDSDMVWMWTADDAVDMIVERSSALDDAAPWAAGRVGRTDVR